MHHHAPEAGLASLLASRGRGGDSVLVHMSPNEVQGLQALALASGGSLTINPHTGLYEAGWLKKLLPMIAGAALNFLVPGFGSLATSIGGALGGGAALGTGLLVGGVEALRTGDLKKGLMAGLGAYGGANIGSALSTTGAQAGKQALTQAAAKDASENVAEQLGLKGEAAQFINVNPAAATAAASPATAASTEALISQQPGAWQPLQTGAAKDMYGLSGDASQFMAANPAAAGLGGMTSIAPTLSNAAAGVRSLVTPAGRETFMSALGGKGAKIATALPLLAAASPSEEDYKPPEESPMLEYVPGGFNPNYGHSRDEPYFLPGYYTRGGQRVTPPFYKAAAGGVVPAPNGMYPMANIQHSEYASSIQNPRKTEVVGGYDAAINPFTGEEVSKQVNFADGGDTTTGMMRRPKDPPRDKADSGPPTQGLEEYYRSLLAAPSTSLANKRRGDVANYIENLNAQVAKPINTLYPPNTGGTGGTGTGTGTGTGGTGTGTGGTGGGGTGTGTGNDFGYFDPNGNWVWTRTPPTLSGGTDPGSGAGFGQAREQAFTPPTQPTQPTPPVQAFQPGPTGPIGPIGINNPFSPIAPVDVWADQQNAVSEPTLEQTVRLPDQMRGLGAIRRGEMMDSGTSEYNFGFAGGGMTGEYKAGGRLLDGPGDGMSDDIPAVIRGRQTQRAALADGEFVVPADVVSHIGNGSTNAGARKLHSMMDRVRKARTGKQSQAPRVKTDRFLPA